MTFLYYLPAITYADLTPERLSAAGLSQVFREACRSQRACQELLERRQVHAHGPDGGHGVILAQAHSQNHANDRPLAMHAAEQEWREVREEASIMSSIKCGERFKDAPRAGVPESSLPLRAFWLGWWRGALPGPDQLARTRQEGFASGYPVVLGDGNIWEVPTIRKGGRIPALPRRMGVSGAGGFELEVLSEFDFAWEASGRIFDRVFDHRPLPFAEAFDLCVEVLSLNYRIGRHEASALGLVTTANFQEIFSAAIDWPKVEDLLREEPGPAPEKKTPEPPDSPNSSPGEPAGFPSIVPAAGSCTS